MQKSILADGTKKGVGEVLKLGSLFTGSGALELGFERTGGFKTEWFVENDGYCQAILKQHWPDTPCYGDITQLDWTTMPGVNILTGGFPCQDISEAGKKAGITGARSGLWKEYAKAIGVLRPRYAVIENVAALARRGLDVVLADLAQAGYDAEWFDLRAADLGALHRRERIFIIATNTHRERFGPSSDNRQKHRIQDVGEREVTELQANRNGRELEPYSNHETDVADTESIRLEVHGEHEINPRVCGKTQYRIQPKSAVAMPSDGWCERILRCKQKQVQRGESFSWCEDIRRIEDLRGRTDLPEPLFRGSRDGLPHWVDRIKACGNAVVPQVAEAVAMRVLEMEGEVKA